jgi:prophage regulatory protein
MAVAACCQSVESRTVVVHILIRRGSTPFYYDTQLSLPSFKNYCFQFFSTANLRRIGMPSKAENSTSRTIRRSQLREIVPLADSTIYEMEQRGEFPRRFALTPRCIVWDLSEVEAWLAARRASPVPRAKHPDVALRKARPVKARGPAPRAASKGA